MENTITNPTNDQTENVPAGTENVPAGNGTENTPADGVSGTVLKTDGTNALDAVVDRKNALLARDAELLAEIKATNDRLNAERATLRTAGNAELAKMYHAVWSAQPENVATIKKWDAERGRLAGELAKTEQTLRAT